MYFFWGSESGCIGQGSLTNHTYETDFKLLNCFGGPFRVFFDFYYKSPHLITPKAQSKNGWVCLFLLSFLNLVSFGLLCNQESTGLDTLIDKLTTY